MCILPIVLIDFRECKLITMIYIKTSIVSIYRQFILWRCVSIFLTILYQNMYVYGSYLGTMYSMFKQPVPFRFNGQIVFIVVRYCSRVVRYCSRVVWCDSNLCNSWCRLLFRSQTKVNIFKMVLYSFPYANFIIKISNISYLYCKGP